MRKKVNKKLIVALLSFVLLFGGTFGSSLAWLLDSTKDVQNTFTTSDINIDLDESKDLNLKMIPGWTITKDPKVTVIGNSEACWLFVEITEDLGAWANSYNAFTDYLNYTVDTGEEKWTQGDGTNIPSNVYYREVSASADDQSFDILKDNKVTVSGNVTKEMMNDIVTDADKPTLSFKAYAVQLYKDNSTKFDATEAWANVPQPNP